MPRRRESQYVLSSREARPPQSEFQLHEAPRAAVFRHIKQFPALAASANREIYRDR